MSRQAKTTTGDSISAGKRGVLQVRTGTVFKSWKQRWFAIEGQQLVHYSDDKVLKKKKKKSGSMNSLVLSFSSLALSFSSFLTGEGSAALCCWGGSGGGQGLIRPLLFRLFPKPPF